MAENIRPGIRLRPSEQRAILVVGDLVASVAAVFGAIYFWYRYQLYQLIQRGIPPVRAERLLEIQVPLWFYLLPLVWLLLMIELYESHTAANWPRTLRGIFIAALVGLLGYSVVFTINLDPESLPRIGVGAFLVVSSILTLVWRAFFIRLYTTSGLMRRVLIVGAGKAGHTLVDVYHGLKPPPFNLVGFVDDDPAKRGKTYHGFRVLGSNERLLDIIDEFHISDLVISITGEIQGATFQAILDAQERGVEVSRMPILYEEMTGRVPVHHLESDWVIRSFVDQVRVSGVYELFKRLMDLLGSLAGLAVFALIFPFAGVATLIDSGLPVLYSQARLGRGGYIFKISKFRTMLRNAEADGEAKLALEKDPRVTAVGRFLRSTRLDELPQFWNVLRGEMSLVGPRAERPELVASFQKQIPFYRARLLVKPGLTGWAQINYGYVSTVTETAVKLEYDLYYIEHRTLLMDLRIVLRTIGTVFGLRGR
jgi:exopolysaccharide biosynthesis polyprenyl glycosylphosphotransferase